MSIELDGNGNSVRGEKLSQAIPPSMDVNKKIALRTLESELTLLRSELKTLFSGLSNSAGDQSREERRYTLINRANLYAGQEEAYSHAVDIVEEKFNELLTKFKD